MILTNVGALPYVPIAPSWFEQSAAFSHEDPRLAVGLFKLLIAAWRAQPAGSIPHSHSYIAQATGLGQDVVAREFGVLTEGFELQDDGRLHHVQMSALAAEIHQRYKRELEEFALASAMAVQSPEHFSMLSVEGAPGRVKPRGLHGLPADFGYAKHPELREWAAGNGYPTEDDQVWLMQRFRAEAASKGWKLKDFAAKFQGWALDQISWGRLPPSRQVTRTPGPGAARTGGAPVSKSAAAMDHNAEVFGLAPRRAGQHPASTPPTPDAGKAAQAFAPASASASVPEAAPAPAQPARAPAASPPERPFSRFGPGLSPARPAPATPGPRPVPAGAPSGMGAGASREPPLERAAVSPGFWTGSRHRS